MRSVSALLSLLAMLLASSAGLAARPADLFELSLEELVQLKVDVATGTPKALRQAPAATSVITAQELEALASQDLVEVLELVPGLHVSRGSFFYSPRLFIRGIVSSFNPHTLVLVNGVPQTSLFVGDRVGLHHGMPVKAVGMVERIEIIRGPGSAVYGADAFSGVINIITRDPAGVPDRGSVAYGSFDSARATLQQGATLGEMKVALSLAYEQSDGADAIVNADAQTGLDQLGLGPPVSFAPGPVELSARDLEVRLDATSGDFLLHTMYGHVRDQGLAQGSADALDPNGRWKDDRFMADLTWRPAAQGQWQPESRLAYLYASPQSTRTNVSFPPGACFPDAVPPTAINCFPQGVGGDLTLREENARLEFSALYSGREAHRVRMGAGFFWGDLYETRNSQNYVLNAFGFPVPLPGGMTDISDTPAVFQPEAQRTNRYLFVQDEWTLASDWELTAGVRHDDYSDVGSTTNPRLSLVWEATETLTGKLIYGEAFRPPAFVELYAQNNSAARGNPRLEPEKLRNAELAFSYLPDNWALDVNFYRFRIRDFIDFVQDPGGTHTAQNVGRIRGQGMEAELRWQASTLVQLLANVSTQRTENESTGQSLGLAPTADVSLRAIWDFAPYWQLTPQLVWIGERERQAGDARANLDGYTTFDLTLRKRWSGGYELAAIGRNLFDSDVREPSRGPGPGQAAASIPGDLPQAGRSLMLEASATW